MIRPFSICFCLSFITASIPSRAANKPYARTDGQTIKVWTNNDLARLHSLGLISIVGQVDEETSVAEPAPIPSKITQDPEWYAEQAARLRDELEYRRAQLREYRQALDDARSLRETTGGIDMVGEDFAITPEAGIEILQRRVTEEQTRLNDVENLARRNDIEPGMLRGR